MLKDSIMYNIDTLLHSSMKDSVLFINNKIELIQPDNSEKLLFGIPIEFASIIIPTIITLIVFGLGIYFQRKSKKKDRLLVLNSFKTVIVEWTKLTENTIATQYSLYQEFKNELKSQENILPIPFVHEPFLIDKLDELNLKELIELIVLNQEGDKTENALTLLNIVVEINKLSNLEKTVKEKYIEFLNYTRSLMDQWNSNLRYLDNYIGNLPFKIANSKNENELKFYKSFRIAYEEFNFSSNKDTTTKTRVEKLISPLENICNESIRNDQSLAEPYSILPILTELLFVEYRWTVYKNGIINYFDTAGENTKTTYKMLKENIVLLDKMRFKKWTRIQ